MIDLEKNKERDNEKDQSFMSLNSKYQIII
jgi:hypothetical protein